MPCFLNLLTLSLDSVFESHPDCFRIFPRYLHLPFSGRTPLLPLGLLTLTVFCCSCTSTRNAKSGESNSYSSLVDKNIGLYEEESTVSMVRKVGNTLAETSELPPDSFSFHIIDQEIPNAFAAPDNSIYVSRGLLALTNDEDSLAGILAHEISHVTENHHLKQERRKFLPNLLSIPGKTIGNVLNEKIGELINAPLENLSRLYLYSYSRKEEEEADLKGIKLAARSGYDPNAMGEILIQMDQTMKLIFGDQPGNSFFESHPSTPDRVEKIFELAQSTEISSKAKPGFYPDKISFLNNLDGIPFGPNPEYGVFYQSRFIHPEHNYSIHMPDDWKPLKSSNTLAALAPDQKAAFFLGLYKFGYDPAPPGEALKDSLYEEYRILPVEESFELLPDGGVYSLRYHDRSGPEPMHIYFNWVEISGRIFQFIALGTESFFPTLEKVSGSIRPLTTQEEEAIHIMRLRIVRTRRGDTLESLGKREKNQWSPAFTAIANGLPEDVVFTEGEPLKIVRKEPYFRHGKKKKNQPEQP